MQSTDVPAKFVTPFANAPSPGTRRLIPAPSQTGGAASLADGFPALNFQPVGAGGIPPFGQDMNGILFQATGWDRWDAAGGPILFDASFSSAVGGYPRGAVVASAANFGQSWLSTVENNLTNPDTGGAGWVLVPVGLASGVSGYGANVTLTAADRGKLVSLGPNITATLPAVPPAAMPISFYANGAATINGGTFFGGGLVGATSIAMASGDTLSLVYTNPNWVVLARNSAFVSFNGRVGAATLSAADVTGALGFTPVRQGGYGAMLNNSISLGWDGVGSILAAVDNNTSVIGSLASRQWVQSLFAPLASPVFSGNPQVPTPPFSNNGSVVNTNYASAYLAPITNPAIQGQLTTTGLITAGGPISAASGNVTANTGRLRAGQGAFGSGDPNAATLLSDFLRNTNGVDYIFHRSPDGTIIQAYWGTTVTGTDFVAFPNAFPNVCIQVVAIEHAPAGWTGGLVAPTIFGVQDTLPAQFSIYCTKWDPGNKVWATAGGVSFRYFAIGY